MQLKLIDSNIAARFWSPAADCDSEKVVAQYVAQGWTEADARNHVQAAIASGAYATDEKPVTATKQPARPTRPEE